MLMKAATSQLVVIDVQEKLLPAMMNPDQVLARIGILAAAARRFAVPSLITEQYPRGLGKTCEAVLNAFGHDATLLEKMTFSAATEDVCGAHLARIAHEQNRRQIILCGIESHVCVLQSALDFIQDGYEVFVVTDAASSRAASSMDFAFRRMERAGVSLVTTEMVLFEWLERAGTDDFRALSKMIR